MTIEEAIDQLQDLRKDRESFVESPDPEDIYNRDIEAISMAIAALREQEERENQKPLTLEELRQMDGEPVWVSPEKQRGKIPQLWMLYCGHRIDKDVYVFEPASGIAQIYYGSAYGKTWLAYRSKPKEDAQ